MSITIILTQVNDSPVKHQEDLSPLKLYKLNKKKLWDRYRAKDKNLYPSLFLKSLNKELKKYKKVQAHVENWLKNNPKNEKKQAEDAQLETHKRIAEEWSRNSTREKLQIEIRPRRRQATKEISPLALYPEKPKPSRFNLDIGFLKQLLIEIEFENLALEEQEMVQLRFI